MTDVLPDDAECVVVSYSRIIGTFSCDDRDPGHNHQRSWLEKAALDRINVLLLANVRCCMPVEVCSLIREGGKE